MNTLSSHKVQKYIEKLQARGESPSVIKSKLESIHLFLNWAKDKGYLKNSVFKQIIDEVAKWQKFISSQINDQKTADLALKHNALSKGLINIKKWLFFKKTPHKIDENINQRPRFELSIYHYIGIVILLIFLSILGSGIYYQFFITNRQTLAYPTSLTRAGRLLSFQGRLTDTLGNPITTATNVQFKLYNVSSGGSSLYATGTCSSTPDQDGIFNVLVGGSGYSPTPPQSVCGTEVPASIFTENADIYMGVTVGSDSEMTPRQQIANVGYAINAETLQGFPPGTGTANIPYINQVGDMIIGAAAPSIRSTYTSATFALTSANAVTIQSAGTGDISLAATGSGNLNFQTGATPTTQMIVTNGGNVGIGTTSPLAKLDVDGGATIGGNLTLYGGTRSIQGTANNNVTIGGNTTGNIFLNPINGTTGGFVAPTTTLVTDLGLSTNQWRSLYGQTATFSGTLSLAPQVQQYAGTCNGTNAGKMYYDAAQTSYYYCNGTSWTQIGSGTGSGVNWWNQSSGLLYPLNSTVDLAIGGTATTSAKFAFINVATGNPTATIAGNLSLVSPTGANPGTTYNVLNGGTYNLQTSVGGDAGLSSRLFVNNGGNVGIGTTTPSEKLYVNGNVRADIYYDTSSTSYYLDPGNGGNSLITNGNVGIGTTLPLEKLDVNGNATVGGNLVLYGAARNIQGTANNNLTIGGNSTGNIFLNPINSAAGGFVAPGTDNVTDLGLSTLRWRNIYGTSIYGNNVYQGGNQVCDISGNCSAATDIWSLANGLLFPKNITADLAIGATSTSSAKFAFTNVLTGNPTATIAGNLGLGSPTGSNPSTFMNILNGGTFNLSTSVGGDAGLSSRLFVNNGGNVGIGTTMPNGKLDVSTTISTASAKLNGLAVNITDTTSSTGGYTGIYELLNPSTGTGTGTKNLLQFQRTMGGLNYDTTSINQYGATTLTTRDSSGALGTGADGSITVTTTKTIDTDIIAAGRAQADAVNFRVTTDIATGSATITTATTPTGLAVGDEIIIINLRDPNNAGTSYYSSGDWTNAPLGKYETHYITGISGSVLTLDSATSSNWYPASSGGYDVVVQRIPQYTNVTINSGGTLTTSAFSTSTHKGGILFFRATGDVIVNTGGSISAAGKGYAGSTTTVANSIGGTTYNGIGGSGGTQASPAGVSGQGGGGGGAYVSGSGASGITGGGGGGGGNTTYSNFNEGGGGGGAYGSVGAGGGAVPSGGGSGSNGSGTTGGAGGNANTTSSGSGGGGGTYGAANLNSLFLGSGGGSGGSDGTNGRYGGGGGGGILFVASATLTNNGTVSSNGSNGTNGGCCGMGGGGGGSGGSILLKVNTMNIGSNIVTATGGTGGAGGSGTGAVGGAGGDGRIRLDYTSLSGTTSPTAGSTNTFPSSTPSDSLVINRNDSYGSSNGYFLTLQTAGNTKYYINGFGDVSQTSTETTGNVNSITDNVLSTGNMLALNSNSPFLTSGSAINANIVGASGTSLTGNIINATASAITTGNMLALSEGGTSNFTGNGILLDFGKDTQNGIGAGFTGNFLKFNNGNTTNFLVDSGGKLTLFQTTYDPSKQINAQGFNLSNNGELAINDSHLTYGTGADGACTISSTITLDAASSNTCVGRGNADAVSFNINNIATAGATLVKVSSTPTGLAANDEVLFITLRDPNNRDSAYYNSGNWAAAHVGQYETHRIVSISGNTLILDAPLTNTYDGINYTAMLQRVPNYSTVTVNNGGTMTISAFSTTTGTGGVLFFRANSSVTVASGGIISANAKGYVGATTAVAYSVGGSTYNGIGGSGGTQAVPAGVSGQGGGGGGAYVSGTGGTGTIGGAGGGGGNTTYSNFNEGGGGGGGFGVGGSGGAGSSTGSSGSGNTGGTGGTGGGSNTSGGGGGGGTYGSPQLTGLYLGSGGGSSGSEVTNGRYAGGTGGGIIFISTKDISNSGSIVSNGGNGTNGGCCGMGGGGGGSGGSIYLKAVSQTLGSSIVTASGGTGGTGGYAGGNGGAGRIRLDYSTSLSGTTSPSAYTQSYSDIPSVLVNRLTPGTILGLQSNAAPIFTIESQGYIVATASSGLATLTLNQTSTGDLLTASASGVTKFTVTNIGNLTAAGTGTFGTNAVINGAGASYFNGGNVGIGITNPGQKLTVEGTLGILEGGGSPSFHTIFQGGDQAGDITYTLPTVQGAVNSSLQNNGSGTLSWFNPNGGTGIFGYWQRTSGSLAPANITDSLNLGAVATTSALVHLAGTSGENSFINTGNVGIGTTSPLEKLDVNGNATVGGNLVLYGGTRTIQSAANTNLTVGGATTGNVFFNPINGTAGGFVAPTSTNVTDLGLAGKIWRNIYGTTIYQGTNQVCDLSGNCNDNGYWTMASGLLYPRNSTVDLAIGGTASTSAKFAFTNVNSGNPTATISGNLSLVTPTGANPATTYNVLNGGTVNFQRSVGGDAGLTSTMFMDKYGNVGIGTTSPGAKLESLSTTEQLRLSYDSSTPIKFTVSSGGDLTIDQSKLVSAGALRFKVSGASNPSAEAFTIKGTSGSVGLVGINNINPTYALDVVTAGSGVKLAADTLILPSTLTSSTAPDILTLQNGTGGTSSGVGDTILFKALNSNANARNIGRISSFFTTTTQGSERGVITLSTAEPLDTGQTSIVERVRVDGYGNVGIGTTVPLALLDVAGNASASGNLSLRGQDTAHTFNVLNGGTLNIQRSVGGDAGLTSTMFMDKYGNVGIGTTTPRIPFDVLSTGGNQLRLTYTDNSVYTNFNTDTSGNLTIDATGTKTILADSLQINGNNIIDSGAVTRINLGATTTLTNTTTTLSGTTTLTASSLATFTTAGSLSMGSTTGLTLGGNATIYGGTASSGTLTLDSTSHASKGNLLINPSGGNVGIGTTSPLEVFDVRGNATVSGNLILAGGLRTIQETANNNLTIGGNTTGNVFFNPINGTAGGFVAPTTTNVTDLGLAGKIWRNIYGTTIYQGTNQVCDVSGNCSTSSGYWDQQSGLLYPRNSTVDLAIGGTATTSAKFAFINVATGNPTATISGNMSLITPTGANPATTHNILNGGSFNLQTSVGGDAGLTSRLFINNGGNVGIGITNPGYLLEVNGTVRTDGNTTIGDASGDTLTINAATLSLVNASTLDLANSSATSLNIEGGLLDFDTSNSRIGIGTTAPSALLDVAGNASASGNLSLRGQDTAHTFNILNGGTLNVQRSVGGDAGLTSTMFMDKYGNVGMGTTSPGYRLDVQQSGSGATNIAQFLQTGGANSGDARILIGNDTYADRFAIGYNTGGGTGLTYGSYLDAFLINRRTTGGLGSLLLGTNDSVRMTILNNGNVGIGITNPSYKLDVTGDVNLTGALRASGNAGLSGYLLTSTGTAIQWNSIASLGLSNFWTQTTSGLLYPTNTTVDLAIGGTATTSAKFAFINVNAGSPTATISGNLALTVPTGANPAELLNVYNGGSLNVQTSVGGDTGLSSRLFVNNVGNVGIGTTTPTSKLHVNGSVTADVYYDTSSTSYYLDPGNGGNSLITSGNIGVGTTSPQNKLDVSGAVAIGTYAGTNTAPTNGLAVSGNVGIGTTGPANKLDVNGAVALGTYAGTTAPSNGLIVSGNVGIGTTGPGGILDVQQSNTTDHGFLARIWNTASTGTPTTSLRLATSGTTSSSIYDVLEFTDASYWNGSITGDRTNGIRFRTGTTISSGESGLSDRMTILPNGNVGIGTTGPSEKLYVNGNIRADILYDTSSTSYYIDPGNGGTSLVTNGAFTSGGDITVGGGSGKITVGTVDPPYTINGKKYATYTTSITGVKEETTGTISTSEYIPGVGYKYTVDFNNVNEGSDLWLFSKVTGLKNSIDNLVALLSPKDNARTWYTVDKNAFTLTFYSSRPTTIAYRLTAPRFDASSWSNNRTDDALGFVINDEGNVTTNQQSSTAQTPQPPQIVNPSGKEIVYNGNLQDFKNQNTVFTVTGDMVEEIVTATQGVFARLQAGFIETENALINNVLVAKSIITDNLTSASANIQLLASRTINVSEKIVSPVVETQDIVATGTAQLNTIATNEIKPQDKDLTINLDTRSVLEKGKLAKIIIEGLAGKTAAVIDSEGNATFSGTLAANQLEAQNATLSGSLAASEASISGTLIAGNIQSENINQLEGNVASQSSSLQNLSSNVNDIQKLLADIKNQPLPNLTNQTNISNLSDLSALGSTSSGSVSSTIAENLSPTFDTLTVTGQSNLYNVSVGGSLLIGSTLVENNSIISLASELKLSALSQITLFNGSVTIAKDGTITTQGALIAQGGVKTNSITPLSANENVTVKLDSTHVGTNSADIANNKLQITNQFGNEVASVNASGSAYFKGLTLDKYLDATQSGAVIAASDNFSKNGIYAPAIETKAQTAGVAILPANQTEIVIYNQSIQNNSLVYLTPTTPNPPQLTVSQKITGEKSYFIVTTSEVNHSEIRFNWLIIN